MGWKKWSVLIAASCLSMASFPGNTYGWVYYNEIFKHLLGTSYHEIGMLWLFAVVIASASRPLYGCVVDSGFNQKVFLGVLSVAFVACICAISLLAEARRSFTLFLVFCALRSIQGAYSVVVVKALNAWFPLHQKPLASLCVVLASFLTEYFPVPISWAMESFEWRLVPLMEAGVVAVLLIPGVVCFQERQKGVLSLNSSELEDDITETTALKQRPSPPLSDRSGLMWYEIEDQLEAIGGSPRHDPPGKGTNAFCSALFWLIVLFGVAYECLWCGVSFYTVPLFATKGLAQHKYVNVFYLVVATGSIVCFLLDALILHVFGLSARIWMISCHCFSLVAACVIWVMLDGFPLVVAFGALISFASFGMVYMMVFADLWGQENDGVLYSTAMGIATIFTGVGPLLLGTTIDEKSGWDLNTFFVAAAALNAFVGVAIPAVYYARWTNVTDCPTERKKVDPRVIRKFSLNEEK